MSVFKLIVLGLLICQTPALAKVAVSYEDAPEFFQPFDPSTNGDAPDATSAEVIDPLLKNKGTWSYQFIYFPKEGEAQDLGKFRADSLIKPASVMKLFTGWMAYSTEVQTIDYLHFMLRRSDNGRAQTTLNKMGGMKKLEAFYTEMNLPLTATNFKGVDGSGLSHNNKVTSSLVTTLLTQIYISGQYDAFKVLLAQPQSDGTLHGRFKSLAYPLYGKTGTLRDTAALAGYVDLNHGTLVFSIISNGLKVSVASARVLIDKVVNKYVTKAEAL